MLTRLWPVAVAWGLIILCAVQGQVVEESETQVLTPPSRAYEPEKIPDRAEAARQIVILTNRFRDEEKNTTGKKDEEKQQHLNLESVAINPQLNKAAQYFADYMAKTSRFGHKADGTTPAERAQKFEYEYCIVAENIAYEFHPAGFTTADLAKTIIEGWKASPGHRKNLLDPDVTEVGVAISQGAENGYFFAVQVFGRPKSKILEFSITNDTSDTVDYKMADRTLTLAPGHLRTHQVCRPRDLAFRWSETTGKGGLIHPAPGDHFVVTKHGDNLLLRKK